MPGQEDAQQLTRKRDEMEVSEEIRLRGEFLPLQRRAEDVEADIFLRVRRAVWLLPGAPGRKLCVTASLVKAAKHRLCRQGGNGSEPKSRGTRGADHYGRTFGG